MDLMGPLLAQLKIYKTGKIVAKNVKIMLTVITGHGGQIPANVNFYQKRIPPKKLRTLYLVRRPVEEAQGIYYI